MNPLTLTHPTGDQLTIDADRAHVISWVSDGSEQLYLSPTSDFQLGTAIRGGVPIIFPQFGNRGTILKHGFARLLAWDSLLQPDSATFHAQLLPSPVSRAHWPFAFQADFFAHLAHRQLSLTLQITNCDSIPFSFTAALHTYLRVTDSHTARLYGLEKLPYQDETRNGAPSQPESDPLTFAEEIDRLYPNARNPLRIQDKDRDIRIEQDGFCDVVVWNPGLGKARGLADLATGGERCFVCVEAAAVETPVWLEPMQTWRGTQVLRVW